MSKNSICRCPLFPDGHTVRSADRDDHIFEILAIEEQQQAESVSNAVTAALVVDPSGSGPDIDMLDGREPDHGLTIIDIMSSADAIISSQDEERSDIEMASLIDNDRSARHKGQGGAINRAMSVLDAVEESTRRTLGDLCGDISKINEIECRTYLMNASKKVSSARWSVENVTVMADIVAKKKTEINDLLKLAEERISVLSASLPALPDNLDPESYNTSHVFASPVKKLDSIAQVVIILAFACHVIEGLSTRGCNFVIDVVTYAIKLTMALVARKQGEVLSLDANQEHILSQLPPNIRSAIKSMGLESRTTVHACCPACDFVVSPAPGPDISRPTYPERCPNRIVGKSSASVCDTPLLVERNGSRQPILPYVTASIVDHLARELSDPETEACLDKACDDLMLLPAAEPYLTRSPFDATFLRGFKGRDDKIFANREGTNAKVMYALHVDFFNPNGNRARGPSSSIGIISIANLGLPASTRYKPEHLHICGIIPGPKEPELANISYYLRPIIDEAEIGWKRGYFLTRTANHPQGRCAYFAFVISINDLPAARKVSGTAGHGSNDYCSTICTQKHSSTIYDTDFKKWKRRDVSQMREQAFKWRDASTTSERDAIFKTYAVRWSELWRLPYWNPSQMLVVDPMHCVLEGIAHYHCRHVLVLDQKSCTESAAPAYQYAWPDYEPDKVPEQYRLNDEDKEIAHVASIYRSLALPLEGEGAMDEDGLQKRLTNKNLSPLRFVCFALEIGTVNAVTKHDYAMLLVGWRKSMPLSSARSRPQTASLATLTHVQKVISETTTPSFVSTVPRNFGTHSAGTIKADEWRILCTIFIPIALVILWGDSDQTHIRELDHSMALFQAITVLCRYSMDVRRAGIYRELLKRWVDGLHTIYSHIADHRHRTNVHMAFHIYDFLVSFGPVMSWWAFPFERLIGVLQKIQTNNIVGGTLEQTLLRSYLGGANLRRWLGRSDCPAVILEIKRILDKAYGINSHIDNQDKYTVRKEGEHAHFTSRGVVFSRASTHVGNSLVLYYPNKHTNSVTAGSIQKIETIQGKEYFYIKRLAPLPEGKHDPFARYPYFPAKTYSSRFCGGEPDKVDLGRIISHAAKYEFSDDRCVILNLSRD